MASLAWDRNVKRYRDEQGRFVSQVAARRATAELLEQADKDMRRIAESLASGKTTIARWQTEMQEIIEAGALQISRVRLR